MMSAFTSSDGSGIGPAFTSSITLSELLGALHDRYNTPAFVAGDPISVPHRFFDPVAAALGMPQPRQNDIEIAGFLAATIAWGNRKAIVANAHRMVDLMGGAPHDFVMNASARELQGVAGFVHRTFNGADFQSFILSLRHVYSSFGSMGAYFEGEFARSGRCGSPAHGERGVATHGESVPAPCRGDLRVVIARFRREFFTPPHPARCEKHLSSIDRGAACKRLNMFLRWMIRRDNRGVDFGIWRAIPPSALYLPLDVHSAATARSLGLLTRRQNDWRAVEEVTARLREIDPVDPVRFDFALFGAGISGETGRIGGLSEALDGGWLK